VEVLSARGSGELSNIVAMPFEKEDVICLLMEDHGVAVVGDDIYDAYYKLDMIESYATVFCHTVLLKKALNLAGL
jgi:ribulose-5-phosphate 4-epimerase/fuculose-1-phosphate aldolase